MARVLESEAERKDLDRCTDILQQMELYLTQLNIEFREVA